jgi:diguanylate cyclase (GGDEF)-like protein
MTGLRSEKYDKLLQQVEKYRLGVPKALVFEAALESAFQSDRLKTRRKQAYWAGLIALLAYNVLLMVNFLANQIDPAAMTRVLFTTCVFGTVPVLVMLVMLRRNRNPRRHDPLLVSAYGLMVVHSILINHSMTAETQVFDAFTLALFPCAGNIALPLSFRGAAFATVLTVVLLTGNALWGQRFPPDAQSTMIQIYVASGILTLAASYRFELSDRTNYLNLLRENLRNGDLLRVQDKLDHLSRTDFLTGLANRREFDQRFDEAVGACSVEKRPLALLLVDIDFFKSYNDRLGHLAGDACLRVVAQAIAGAVEPSKGFVARYGGEEFVVVLSGTDFEAASTISERVRQAVGALDLPHPGAGAARHVSVSIGAASLNPEYPEDAASLLLRADAALYRAKRSGRNRTEVDLRVVTA